MIVPKTFQHPLFFTTDTMDVPTFQPFPMMMKHVPFYYDMTQEGEPWQRKEQSLPAIFQLWEEEKRELAPLFATRQGNKAKDGMVRGISYFLCALHWFNERAVSDVCHWEKEVGSLPLSPLNVVDRLSFIFARPILHHSFVQLDELFTELMKLFYKQMVQQKRD
ncbi:YpoC family protein [Anoxybacillus eryuanensis]|uniref:YpoC family protein n=1 Tax=Anoxybacillus eryuanensis TaxID=651866 RepID=UPI003EF596B8